MILRCLGSYSRNQYRNGYRNKPRIRCFQDPESSVCDPPDRRETNLVSVERESEPQSEAIPRFPPLDQSRVLLLKPDCFVNMCAQFKSSRLTHGKANDEVSQGTLRECGFLLFSTPSESPLGPRGRKQRRSIENHPPQLCNLNSATSYNYLARFGIASSRATLSKSLEQMVICTYPLISRLSRRNFVFKHGIGHVVIVHLVFIRFYRRRV